MPPWPLSSGRAQRRCLRRVNLRIDVRDLVSLFCRFVRRSVLSHVRPVVISRPKHAKNLLFLFFQDRSGIHQCNQCQTKHTFSSSRPLVCSAFDLRPLAFRPSFLPLAMMRHHRAFLPPTKDRERKGRAGSGSESSSGSDSGSSSDTDKKKPDSGKMKVGHKGRAGWQ